MKMRCMILTFASDFDPERERLDRSMGTLMRHYEVQAAVGWEQLFEHPEGSDHLTGKTWPCSATTFSTA